MATAIADTKTFRAISLDSISREYNRLPSDELLDRLDPDGTHVVSFSMLHEHRAGVEVEPHMRTIWMVKLADVEGPADVTLDMTMENFNSLRRIDKGPDGEYVEVEKASNIDGSHRGSARNPVVLPAAD